MLACLTQCHWQTCHPNVFLKPLEDLWEALRLSLGQSKFFSSPVDADLKSMFEVIS